MCKKDKKNGSMSRTTLVVPWFRLCASTAVGAGSVPGWRTKIPHSRQCDQNIKSLCVPARILEGIK